MPGDKPEEEILTTCMHFVEWMNDEFNADAALTEETTTDPDKIHINVPGQGHLHIDRKTGEVETKITGKIPEKLREALGQQLPVLASAGQNIPAVNRSQAARSLREIQDDEAKPFCVDHKSGKMAPTAALISRAANAEGLSFEILDYDHRRDFVKVAVRATAPGGRYNDAAVSVYKEEYLAPYAWELVQNNCQSAVVGADPDTGMPIFREGAVVKVPKSRDGSRLYEEIPALLWLAQKLSARWLFAPRSCETKAKARAAKQLLNTDSTPQVIQEPEELADERMETEMVEA